MTLDGFTEPGGGLVGPGLGRAGPEQSVSQPRRDPTLETRHPAPWPAAASARLEWSHELEDIGDQGVRYADWAGSPRSLIPLDTWSLSGRLMFSLGYRAMYGDASSSQGGQLGLKYGW
jgi:hypothetical protein